MSRVYVFLADGFEEVEALAPVDLLRRAGIEVKTVSVSDSLRVIGRSRITVEADLMYGDADPEKADMLVLPGGMPGTTYLLEHKGLAKDLKKAAKDGRYLAAICAAPTVLAAHGLLEGKDAVCYPGLESKLIAGGAKPAPGKKVVKDGKVITGRGAGTAVSFGLKLIEALNGKESAEEVKRGIAME